MSAVTYSETDRLKRAVDYCLYCFKSKAMSMTADQVKDGANDIINGIAHWHISQQSLDYDFVSGKSHENKLKEGN